MPLSDRQLLHFLSRMPFIDSAEMAGILGEAHATVHRALTSLLADGLVGRVSHGTTHLPSSQRYYLTANGIRETAGLLGFATPSDFVRAYPVSREWLTLLIRRMDAVAAVYRLAASLSPGIGSRRTHVEFQRRGRFDATIILHDGRSFGVVRQGLALRRRSLYDRLRAIAEYDYSRRPGTVLILVPSVWEERLTTRFCEERNIRDCYVAVESRDALERRDLRLWCTTSWVIGSRFFSLKGVVSRSSPGGGPRTESPERKRASIPDPERMAQAAPAFGVSPSEKRTLDLITDHPMIPREHLAIWLGVSEGRVSQMMRSLVNTWGLIERRAQRGRHPLHPVRRGHTLRHAQGPRPASHDAGHLEHGPHHRQTGPEASRGTPHRDVGEADEARRRHHVVPLEAGGRGEGRFFAASSSGPSPPPGPTGPTTGAIRPSPPTPWGTCSPAAFTSRSTFEHELRARHPRGVLARLRPYESYYWSPEHKEDQPPFPTTLFVVDTEEVEDTYVRAAARMGRMSLPILVSCIPVLSANGILGRSWRPLWELESPRLLLSELSAYQWDSLYHRMRQSPVGRNR